MRYAAITAWENPSLFRLDLNSLFILLDRLTRQCKRTIQPCYLTCREEKKRFIYNFTKCNFCECAGNKLADFLFVSCWPICLICKSFKSWQKSKPSSETVNFDWPNFIIFFNLGRAHDKWATKWIQWVAWYQANKNNLVRSVTFLSLQPLFAILNSISLSLTYMHIRVYECMYACMYKSNASKLSAILKLF